MKQMKPIDILLAPCAFANKVQEALANCSLEELARQIEYSETFLKHRLLLVNLHPSIQEMVDKRIIPVNSGYILAKFSHERQFEILPSAMKLTWIKFSELMLGD